jgi:uncharacterized membrane protein
MSDSSEVTARASIIGVEMSATLPRPARLEFVDVLRGAVMILMALDHVRDFFSNATIAPLDLAHTTPGLFFTRWVTHFCAPTFVLLAGISAFLWAHAQGKRRTELARFLITRGLWLIILELTVVRLAWFFSIDYQISLAQVIWALGWSMLALAGFVLLPRWLVLGLAVLIIVGHNLLDDLPMEGAKSWFVLWTVLHKGGLLGPPRGPQLFVLYPLIPWLGVMAAGYGLGPLLLWARHRRRMWLLRIGLGLFLMFVALRITNRYGDPMPWSAQKNTLFTLLSFVNVEKYPPSLLFLLLTLGPALIALGLLDRPLGLWARPIATFGQAPLFFYVLHLFVIHGLAVSMALVYYRRADWLIGRSWLFRIGIPVDYGFDLLGVYVIWVGVIFVLYPLCQWFAELKRKRQSPWLSYL